MLIWIERRPGAVWAVGRQVNPEHRQTDEPRVDDYIWEGHELDDCLEAANAALEDDAVVSEDDGATERVRPFRPRRAARAAREVLLRALVLRSGHSRFASGIGSPCGSCVGKPSARSIRASSSSEMTCSSRSASSWTSSTCRPSVSARYSSSRRWCRITSSATRSPDGVRRAPAVLLVLEQVERGQLLHHRRRRRRRDRLVLRECPDRHAAVGRPGACRRSSGSPGSTRRAVPSAHGREGNVASPCRSVWDTAPTPTTPSWSGRSRRGRSTPAASSSSRSSSDIQTLNEWAVEGRLEVTALSAGAYPAVADRYRPPDARRIVRRRLRPDRRRAARRSAATSCARSRSSRPAPLTTACRVLRLALGDDSARATCRSTQVLDEVASRRAEAGLLIHEGQLTYADAGLHKLLDLGVWWQEETGLPLPLGVVVVAPRPRAASTTCRPCCASRSTSGLRTATRRSRTRRRSVAASTTRPRTSSSPCTSTT